MKMNRLRHFPKLLLCLLLAISFILTMNYPAYVMAAPTPAVSAEPLVIAIEIRGTRRIEEGAIKAKLTQKTNQPLSQDKISEDVKTVYKLGYFDDVKVETEFFEGGLKVIYIVKEKPTITKIAFYGNSELDDKKLKEKTTVTAGSISDNTLIQDNVKKLKDYYDSEGYYLSEIYPILSAAKDGEVTLTFEIKEGPKLKIRSVEITGNQHIATKKIKKVLNTTKWWILSFFDGSGFVKKDALEEDVLNIQNLYMDYGYLNVKIAEPKVIVSEKGITVRFDISEGQPYNLDSIIITGNTTFDTETLSKLITMKPGAVFSKSALTKSINTVTDYYTERGYATAIINPIVQPNETALTVKVDLKVEEGKVYKIGTIEFSDNTKTRDKVLRREITINEGDTYDSKKLKRSFQNIKNLDYFDNVEVSPKPQPDSDIVDIDVKVKEKMTGFISVGGGYSSVDKMIGMIQLTQTNLFGTGDYMKIAAEAGGSSLYEITYKHPWFLDKPYTVSGSIYRLDKKYIDYSRKATGIVVGISKRFWEYWEAGLAYRFEAVNIHDVEDTASRLILEQEGYSTTGSITPSISRDTRDSYIDPTTGSRNSAYVTFAGALGSNHYIKTGIESLWFFPFIGPTTYSVRARYGYATGYGGNQLPLYERFYVGGITTVRGVEFGYAGPQDWDGTYIGGTSQVLLNNEIIFPIFPEIKLKGVYFVDIGTALGGGITLSDVKYTTGAGVRWISPFGPIRLEYGVNLKRTDGDSFGRLEFSFGNFF
ncbi:outer membrane protein assembly factor BamA [Candidatus Magnetominusculus xianensis]|uniref:Outer membrane protein assembly factor BamA n=1 Tax=Candidatus Magnetominusculus xianensis TaxID=1748249 RepID=A0ABR5SGH1_9BACT|nr:outer membrane protein assembly factor BamA [Candidatus Magnetominusculus xianensis]KWT89585.1 putative outer membrane protein [Candidatus Magnetominusculus xianensis]MBF0405556.1 outer membrane protein assembly factor BamA [Nitrospirota bacterium]